MMATDVQTSMRLFTLYVPVADNAGRPFPPQKLAWVRKTLTDFAGGCTVLPQGEGLWVAPDGRLFRDPVVVIQVVSPTTPQMTQFFEGFARELAVQLGQEEVFLFSLPVSLV